MRQPIPPQPGKREHYDYEYRRNGTVNLFVAFDPHRVWRKAFAPAEARRILRRLEFHYTPKHASWLNMVEIEIGVLQGQCLGRRIADPKRLKNEIAAWEARARINWMFTTDKARAKLGRAYPRSLKESESL